jgi:hypothetical protein
VAKSVKHLGKSRVLRKALHLSIVAEAIQSGMY